MPTSSFSFLFFISLTTNIISIIFSVLFNLSQHHFLCSLTTTMYKWGPSPMWGKPTKNCLQKKKPFLISTTNSNEIFSLSQETKWSRNNNSKVKGRQWRRASPKATDSGLSYWPWVTLQWAITNMYMVVNHLFLVW